ncbi:hypothetical protein FKW77_004829 [Venturia effusa]|uniref:NADPH-dependent FMN reductase-like domain-containing protein n=1 Tax=Venturia effusa TaxID=50376 RepID=A0A517LC95_9PEZI|nr:hypothetical protein FKW77_004829 [Venturia effusa]
MRTLTVRMLEPCHLKKPGETPHPEFRPGGTRIASPTFRDYLNTIKALFKHHASPTNFPGLISFNPSSHRQINTPQMHILGIQNGSQNGNSSILLKAALLSAQKADPTITTSYIHIQSVSIPRNPVPLPAAASTNTGIVPTSNNIPSPIYPVPDDREAVRNAILDANALIFSSAVYSHQPPGALKAVLDTILGPFADASMAHRFAAGQARGDERYADAKFDPRLLRHRVVGFMAVAGSPFLSQITMALPTLHQMPYCLHAKVVDQIVFRGFAVPGAVLLDEAKTVRRAEVLGRNVVSQMGKSFDEAVFLGERREGDCPFCHLSTIEVDYTRGNEIGCITCGHRGRLVVGDDGRIGPKWDEGEKESCITMAGKEKHQDDIMGAVAGELKKIETVKEKKEEWDRVSIPRAQIPSLDAKL